MYFQGFSKHFAFYEMKLNKKLACFLSYQPCYKLSETNKNLLDNNIESKLEIKTIPTNKIKFDKSFTYCYSDIIQVRPLEKIGKSTYTFQIGAFNNLDKSQNQHENNFKYTIYRYDPENTENSKSFWKVCPSDIIINSDNDKIDIKVTIKNTVL